MQTLSNRLIEARTERGWSQQMLADKAGVSQSLIGNLESGVQRGSTKLTKIADALGVSAHWLADGKGPKPAGAPPEPKTLINMAFLWRCQQTGEAWARSRGMRPSAHDKLQTAVLLYEMFVDQQQAPDTQMHALLDRWALHVERQAGQEQ